MEGYEQELHINDELFAGMRDDADRVLQKLLKNMVEKDSLEGKVTIGIDVTLVQEFIPNRDPNIEGETRRVLTPKFSHKVGSVMQIKNEAKGDRNCDGTELVWDEERGEYVLRPIANTEQMTIFDADFRCVNDETSEAGGGDEGEGQPALEGRRVAASPGPVNTEGKEMGGEAERNAPDGNEEGSEAEEGKEAEDMSETFDMNRTEDIPFEGKDDGYSYEESDEEE